MMSDSEEATLRSINLKTFMALIGIVGIIATTGGVWFITKYRVDQIEKFNQEEAQRVDKIEALLAKPRFTLEDYEIRTQAFRDSVLKELDRRAGWMKGHDSFRLETVKTGAETAANLREIKNLVTAIKSDLEKLKGD